MRPIREVGRTPFAQLRRPAMGIIKREAEQKQRKREEREAAAEERRMAPIAGGLKLGEE